VDFQKTKQAVIDSGLLRPTGIVLSPDHNLLFVAESHTHWVYSYLVGHNGSLSDKQRFYWLHSCEGDDDAQSSGGDYSDATDMACDTNGNLYVATRMGVQICDRNGRVEAILTLPSGRAVTSLCFGGRDNDMLYAICSGKIYRRQMQAHGVPPWAPPITLPGFGAG
jgi:sugar lactone lactonase YvrE